MTSSAPLDQAWSYPLFEALYGRRSRRFGLGFEMPEGPFRYKSAHAPWDSNRRGSTPFLPVCDVSAEMISLIAQFVDPALRRYAPASGGFNIVDDRHGFRPAGTERWLKDGFLDAEQVLPLSILER